jgi:hypothetical protein
MSGIGMTLGHVVVQKPAWEPRSLTAFVEGRGWHKTIDQLAQQLDEDQDLVSVYYVICLVF